jgi:hypothetical protein
MKTRNKFLLAGVLVALPLTFLRDHVKRLWARFRPATPAPKEAGGAD